MSDSYVQDQWQRAWAARDPKPSPPGTPEPSGGWSTATPPPMSANQNGPGSPTADGRLWWTPVKGPGYYFDPNPNQAQIDAAARAMKDQGIDPATGMVIDPYEEPGLLTVIMAVGNQAQRTAAGNDLGTVYPDQAQYTACVNTNAQADPTWNGAIAKMLGGWGDVGPVWASVQGDQNLSFTEAMLAAAKPTTDRYANL